MNVFVVNYVSILCIVKYVNTFALYPGSNDRGLAPGFAAPKRSITIENGRYYYTTDEYMLRIPPFNRPRRRKIRIFDKMFSISPISEEELLNRIKEVGSYKDFSLIENTFLQICRYLKLDKNSFANHELFPEIRFHALKNKSLFGRVYSNELSRMFKAKKVFLDEDFLNHVKIYTVNNPKDIETWSLSRMLENCDGPLDLPESFFERLEKLCTVHGRLSTLNNILEGIVPTFRVDCFPLDLPRVIVSTWGVIAYNQIRAENNFVIPFINNICQVKKLDLEDPSFEMIKAKYNEDKLMYCDRMTTTVMNLFEQVYKLSEFFDDSSTTDNRFWCKSQEDMAKDVYNKILIPVDKTTINELISLYHYSKHSILDKNNIVGLLAGFTEAVQYFNEKVQTEGVDKKHLEHFRNFACKIYMKSIMEFWSYDSKIYHRMETIYRELFDSVRGEYFKCFLSKSILRIFHDNGLENFCNIVDYKPDPQKDKIYCILRGKGVVFLFDLDNGKIIKSKDTNMMDSWNLGIKVDLPQRMKCHIIFHSLSEDPPEINNIVKRTKARIMRYFDSPIIDNFMTLDFPRRLLERKLFNPNDTDGGIFAHPVNGWCSLARIDKFIPLGDSTQVPCHQHSDQ